MVRTLVTPLVRGVAIPAKCRLGPLVLGSLLVVIAACSESSTATESSDESANRSTEPAPTVAPPSETAAPTATPSTVTPSTVAPGSAAPSGTTAPPPTVLSIDCRLDAGATTIADREFERYLPDDVGTATNPTGGQSPLLLLLHGFGAEQVTFGDTDPSSVTARRDCAGQAEVSLLAVSGLGHVWAGSDSPGASHRALRSSSPGV